MSSLAREPELTGPMSMRTPNGDAWDIPTDGCPDCGADLPLELVDAGRILYGGESLDPASLVALIAASLRDGIGGYHLDDNSIGTSAIVAWLGTQPEWLVAAVRHVESGSCARNRAERAERHAEVRRVLGDDDDAPDAP